MEIKLYTDGACKGNPGPGGWGCVLSAVLENGEKYEKEHSGGCRLTTNNRMELAAVINGLKMINGSHDVEVISDSQYVCNAFNKNWIDGWKKSNWKKGKLLNLDMWKELIELVESQKSVKFTWIKGHAGHPYNEKCDKMAVRMYKNNTNLGIDEAYENLTEKG